MAQGWGKQRAASVTKARGLWIRRLIATSVALLLIAWLTWLLIRPLLHPRTHLVLLAGDVSGSPLALGSVPADYVVDDLRELLAIEPVLHRDVLGDGGPLVLGSLQNPDEMQQLADRLNERLSGQNDVVIIYVSAHGLTQDGDAWLLASGADPNGPLGCRYRLASLLAQLRECQASTKVLLLEAGRIEYDPLRGLLANDFPTRLMEQVEQLGDPHLWVLVSHSDDQRSHLSAGLQRSVFGYFVTEGLKGAADVDGNRSIDFGELQRYVTTGVSGWVRQTTGGAAAQTPLVAWGGGDASRSPSAALIAVPREAKEAAIETGQGKSMELATKGGSAAAEATDQATERGRREMNSLIATGLARSTPSGSIGHYVGDAAQRAASNIINRAKLPGVVTAASAGEEPTAAETTAKSDEATAQQDGKKKPGEVSESTKDEGSKADQTAAADEKPKNGSKANDERGQSKQSAEITPEQLAAELHQAWQRRDALAAADSAQIRPIDYAPHLWRELEQRLLALDRALRTGFLLQPERVERQIRTLLDDLDFLTTGKQTESLRGDSLGRRIAAMRPGIALMHAQPASLSTVEWIARQGGPPVAAEVAMLIARLDRLNAAGNRSDLEKFAAELKPEHERWTELRLVRRLAGRPDLDWRLVQLLLESVRAGEQAATGAQWPAAWLIQDVARADDLRLAAERQLLAEAKFDRQAMIVQLTEAHDIYRRALSDLAALTSAERMANVVWHRVPEYLSWNAAAKGESVAGPTGAQIQALLTKLDVLERLCDSPDSTSVAAIREATTQLAAARAEIERPLQLAAIEQLADGIAGPGEAWRMQLLLETTLPNAEIRRLLSTAISAVDASLSTEVKPANGANGNSGSAAPDDSLVQTRSELVRRMWQVALGQLSLPDFDAFVRAIDGLRATTNRERQEAVASRLQDLMRSQRADFARGIETDLNLSSAASRPSRLGRLKAWDRLLRLADPRQENTSAEAAWAKALADAAAYDLLAWQSSRALKATEDAPPQDSAYLRQVADGYRQAATAIPRQPPLGEVKPSLLEIQGPEDISLTYVVRRDAEFTLHNTTAERQKVWVAVESDPGLVEAKSNTLRSFYRWSELNAAEPAGTDATTISQRISRLAPTLELAPGQTVPLGLYVRRRAPSTLASHLVIRVVTANDIARHDVAIQLPPPEDIGLIVAGPVGRWSRLPAGVELLPFPNRVNAFTLQLTNGKPKERKVDVEAFPLQSLPPQGIPPEPLSEADANRLRSEMTFGSVVAEARAVELAAGSEPVTLALKAPEAAALPIPGAGKTGGTENGAKATPPAPPSDKPPPMPLPNGLLVVITDQDDKRQTFRHLDIAPQRPQRYIRPQVRYRAGLERIEIRVTSEDPSLLPTDGVHIHGEIAEPLSSDAERQLDAVLSARQSEAEMYVEVPSSPGQAVTLRLTVDDYPRALYYRVPTSGETGDVSEDFDTLAVRIVGLPDGTVYKPPTASIPVELAIDAPASMQKTPPLRVEVGIDQNRDRELRGEETVLLTADRQVTAALVGIGKAGELQIQATVSDVTVKLPAASLAGGRANILAHAVLGDRDAWSEPVEIVSDAQPPRVGQLELRPAGTAVIGNNVMVSALADDLGLSGVAKVEAAFDLDRSGKVGSSAPPVGAALGDDGRWLASVPTAGLSAGSYNLLVRATDKAGNASAPARASVRLIPKELADAEQQKSNAADIVGLVTYGDAPQAAVTVSLNRDTGTPASPKTKAKGKAKGPPPPPPLAQATTDARGQFTFPKVAPGKYVVTAEALIRNRVRDADAPVAFTKPSEVQPLTLKLK